MRRRLAQPNLRTPHSLLLPACFRFLIIHSSFKITPACNFFACVSLPLPLEKKKQSRYNGDNQAVVQKGVLAMQIAVNFQNDAIAQKVLWFLDHFKNEGVDVIRLDTGDDEVLEHFRDGLQEVQQITQGEISSRPVQEFLNEL